MEASEKPQLPLDEGQAVRAIDDRLVIERLEVHDAGAARVVREQAKKNHPPAETVARAIEIGARLIESEGTAANVDFVNAQFERHMGRLGEQLSGVLESGSEELAEHITSTFGIDRSDSVQQQIRELLIKANEHQRTEMIRLFNSEEGTNPLADFKSSVTSKVAEAAQRSERQAESMRETHARESKEMRDEIAALRTEIARLTEQERGEERVAEAEAAGTRKGRGFEGRVDGALERIAATRGDASSHTGGEGAEGGGKKGDTLIELEAANGPACGRIVFEAKDTRPSKNEAWKQLNEAMARRAAAFGVLVVAGEENVPAGRETLTEYEGNKMIVAVDREDPEGLPLEVAYRLAAARVVMARERDLTVDAPAVRDAAEEAVTCLKQAQAIRATLTGIKTSSDKARATLDEMVEAVRARLERVESLIEVAEEDK
ncbi:MAG TPA: DUF2130 domain-containing protein [Solirubrobacterales bacterium]|jgi:hypothetical protein